MFVCSVRNMFEYFLKLGCTTITLFMIYTEILTRDVKADFFMAENETGSQLVRFPNPLLFGSQARTLCLVLNELLCLDV